MQYAFLGMLVPDAMKEEVKSLSVNNMQDAANALQWHLYNGLCQNLGEGIKILNILPVSSFPQYYKKPVVRSSLFESNYCQNNLNIGFCNVKLIRKYIQPRKVYNALKKWCIGSPGEKVLFIYTAADMFITPVSRIKSRFPELRVCTIVADLPDMSSLKANKSIFEMMLQRVLSSRSYAGLHAVDAFVLLTRYMADYMKISQPYCVVEGISTQTAKRVLSDTEIHSDEKIILYTGTLHKRFGVMKLAEAFSLIKDDSYRLIICGVGDSVDELRKCAEKDKRIDFRGQLSRDEVLALQRMATVLVNPRQNNEEFTKYSFPSKNLEYLSSGTPLIAYKLDGIPDDYDNCIFYVENNSIEALRDKMVEVCSMDGKTRLSFAEKAQRYVLNEKNELVQTKKIIDLLKENGLIEK